MSVDLYEYARQYLTDAKQFEAALSTPLLVWEGAAAEPEKVLATLSGVHTLRPASGEAKAFELKKLQKKQNAFAMGITVGRTEHNDVVIAESSVSRFHAYFQLDPKSNVWKVVDADSKNGSWVNGQKLAGSKAEPLPDGAHLRFGDINLRFYNPSTFVAYLRQRMSR